MIFDIFNAVLLLYFLFLTKVCIYLWKTRKINIVIAVAIVILLFFIFLKFLKIEL